MFREKRLSSVNQSSCVREQHTRHAIVSRTTSNLTVIKRDEYKYKNKSRVCETAIQHVWCDSVLWGIGWPRDILCPFSTTGLTLNSNCLFTDTLFMPKFASTQTATYVQIQPIINIHPDCSHMIPSSGSTSERLERTDRRIPVILKVHGDICND